MLIHQINNTFETFNVKHLIKKKTEKKHSDPINVHGLRFQRESVRKRICIIVVGKTM